MSSIRRARRRGVIAGAVIGSSRAKRSAESQAAQQAQTTEPASESVDSAIEQLKQLAELKDQGILTQEEFDHKKKQILGM